MKQKLLKKYFFLIMLVCIIGGTSWKGFASEIHLDSYELKKEGIQKEGSRIDLNKSVTTNPYWIDKSNIQVASNKSFKFSYNNQIDVVNIINAQKNGSKVEIQNMEEGNIASFTLTHIGSYGPIDVNVKITILSLKNNGISLDIGSKNFMRWLLHGNAEAQIQYEFFSQNNEPLKVGGYNYFRGINSSKIIAFKQDQIDQIFTPNPTDVLYSDVSTDGYVYYGAKVGGWTKRQEIGLTYSESQKLNFILINNDGDDSSIDYEEVPLPTEEFNNLLEHPLWNESTNATIPKENYFTFLFNNKIDVNPIDGNVSIKKQSDGFVVSFDKEGTILVKNVGYYNGQWLSLYINSNIKNIVGKNLNVELMITKDNFLRWALSGNITNNVQYNFVDSDLKPIEVAGYMSFVGLNSSKSLGLNSNSIQHLYSTSPSDIQYSNFGDIAYFKSKTGGWDEKHEFTFAYKRTTFLNFFIENHDRDTSSLDYTKDTKARVGIPDPTSYSKKYNILQEDTDLNNDFSQIIPYEPVGKRDNNIKWKIQLPNNNTVIFEKLKITDENDIEQTDLFTITKDMNTLTVIPKEEILESDDFYNHFYKFILNYSIDYEKETDISELNNEGFFINEDSMEFILNDFLPVSLPIKTDINFKSETTVIYQNQDGEQLLSKIHKDYINHVSNLKPEFIDNQNIKQHIYTSSNSLIESYKSKYTDNTIVLNYRRYNLPVLELNNPTDIVEVKSIDGKLNIKGDVILDAPMTYDVYIRINNREEMIGKSKKEVVVGENEWEVFEDYTLKGLEEGKYFSAEIYAKDKTGTESNIIPIEIYYAGGLKFTKVPLSLDFGVTKIPLKEKEISNSSPYEITASDLRGPKHKYNLYLTVVKSLRNNQQVYNESIFYINRDLTRQSLNEGDSLLIDTISTGVENKNQVTNFSYPIGQGIQLTTYPNMHKGIYDAIVEWALVDAPS